MTAMRRVALVLHALTPDDRDWMLARLDTHERESLQSLLDELARLGLVRDPALVREATGRSVVDEASTATSADAAVEKASLHAIAALPSSEAVLEFVDEPAAILACILKLHPWAWGPSVLDALGRAKREQVEAFGAMRPAPAHDCGHALRAALIEELAERLGKVRHEAPAASQQTRWWRRFSWGRS